MFRSEVILETIDCDLSIYHVWKHLLVLHLRWHSAKNCIIHITS